MEQIVAASRWWFRLSATLNENNIAWPRTFKGSLALSDETFRDMSKFHPLLADLHQVRESLSQLRSNKLAISKNDYRNRTMISPFRSVTSRNQPSNSKFIFGFSAWYRSLVKPEPDTAIAYIDWSQQEFGIAAALSNDENMKLSYKSGDPYLAFAKLAKAAPEDATKESHKEVRKLFKECVLATQYCMGAESLAIRIGKSVAEARELLEMHKKTYKPFWEWSDRVLDFGMLNGYLDTILGWRIHLSSRSNPRTIRNFPMQANGAEMLRVALNMLRENGIKILAPVHDAILIESNLKNVDKDVERTIQLMKEASAIILNGFELEADAEIIRHPDRYMDERGIKMWNKVEGLIRN